MDQIHSISNLYKTALLDDVIPFWEKHSVDEEYGGYFTCLDRYGKVYDTDKFMWLQGRQAWTFSMLYNKVEGKSQWLDVSHKGIKFLKDHGRDASGSFCFSVDRSGNGLIRPYNIYSDCFAALAFNEYSKASGDQESHDIAMQTYHKYLSRLDNPKGAYEKSTGYRKLKSFGLPMMTAYLTSELSDNLDADLVQKLYADCVKNIIVDHYDQELGVIREHTGTNGEFLDCYEGRLINPGHGIEAMWFLIDIAIKIEDKKLISTATDICLEILNYSWDKEYGGIFYFMDAKGASPQQLEWDQKLWWPHLEALIALSKAYLHTGRIDVLNWYHKVHKYTWEKFPDPEYGEWFGYLNRSGKPLLDLKGGKWKGCFHVPRGLYECWQNFKAIDMKNEMKSTNQEKL